MADSADDQGEDNGVLFWVNKSGFPLDKFTWDRMWDHVEKIHPEGEKIVINIMNRSLKPVPMPQVPINFSKTATVVDKVDTIQKYMKELQYNHTGTQFFEIRKNRPLSGLMDVAKEMVRESLPIKCLEAVVLGIHLTNGMPGIERFPISFKTSFNGNYHRHVVLGIYHAGKFGSIGMSRRDDLAYKALTFKSLSDLVFDFHGSYKSYWHTVKKTKVGSPISHDPHSFEQIAWKTLHLKMNTLTQTEAVKDIERHSKEIRAQSRLRDMYSTGGSTRKAKPVSVGPTSPRKSLTIPPSPDRKERRSLTTVERSPATVERPQAHLQISTHHSDSLQMEDKISDKLKDYQIRI